MRRSVTPRCSGPETSSPATFSRIRPGSAPALPGFWTHSSRSEEHTSELQSRLHLVCRLLLEKKKKKIYTAKQATTEFRENCSQLLDPNGLLSKTTSCISFTLRVFNKVFMAQSSTPLVTCSAA